MVNASEAHRGPEAHDGPAVHRGPEPPRAPQAHDAADAHGAPGVHGAADAHGVPDPRRALVDELLAALDPLPFPRRMRELAGRARAASAEGRLGALIEELERRGTYERRLAAVAAAASGRTGHLAARLADPDPVVRRRALDTARRGGPGAVPDDALEAAFEDAPATVRRELARTVVAGRRTALADRLIEPFRERWGDGEAARLLPGCGAETVARLLPGLFHAVGGWRPLVSRHPVAVLDEAARQLAALPVPLRADWWTRYAPCVALAAPVEPDRVLELLEDYGQGPLPTPVRARLPALVAAEPSRTLRLLLAPEHSGTRRRLDRAVLRRVVRADPPELAELGRALRHDADADALARLLAALPPARRSAFYDQATGRTTYHQAMDRATDGQITGQATYRQAIDRATDRQATDGRDSDHAASAHTVIEPAVLEVLPRPRRQAEARRMAARARERGAPWTTVLESVAHLPVEEAREELEAAVRRPSAEDRALAHPLLIRCVARSGDPDALTELLRLLERLRNEQDPVRSAALGALARTHPALFTDDAAEHLDRIAADAISARDSSSATRQALRHLAVALLREHAVTGRRQLLGWALRTLTRLAGSVGAADLGRLDHQLRRGQEQAVFEALRPWLEAGAERVDHELTFALARSLGRRAHTLPELQELLWQAISFGSDATARTAIGLWLEPPAERDARVAELLAHEPSAAVLPPVLAVLTRRRTDLLDLVLADNPPYGRFLTPGTHWTPPTGRDTGRWLPRQQAAAARVLDRAAADTSLRPRQRAAAVADAAPIPGHGAATVRRWTDAATVRAWTDTDDDDVVLAETALAALARTDRPGEALPALLAHAGDDRARVAMYAATRASRYVEPSRLGRLVRGVLAPDGVATAVPPVPAKVTSRKEAVRLAATLLPVADAAALLADAFEQPGQHPDVQAACVAFATGLLDTQRAWELLTAAARGRRELRHAVLRTRPLDLPEAHRGRYAQLIRAVCDTDDPEVAAAGYGALARWSPWAPDAAPVLVAAVTDLGNRASWRPAADALLDLMAAAPDGSPGDNPLAWALAALATADARPGGPDAEPDRDRPAHRRIRHLADRLATRARMRPRVTRRTARAAGELLAGYEMFVQEAAHVLVNALDLNARPGPLTAALARLARLHTTRPALAVRTADALRRRLNTATRPGSDAALLRAARELDEDGGHASGLFAATLTEAAGARTEWAEPWRERLRALRGHPHADVRDAALRLTTVVE
ncbi:hypothetical protein [Streptomyces violaceusniger]|uniref:Uncharacterized protein n=1 Tax=Streptomyces violaceusniger TaxID=68280 RepID=A0A4D4LH58_STRVO|nr:hypothetical protein SVIO_084410 [Streptomyces violaceusniger]